MATQATCAQTCRTLDKTLKRDPARGICRMACGQCTLGIPRLSPGRLLRSKTARLSSVAPFESKTPSPVLILTHLGKRPDHKVLPIRAKIPRNGLYQCLAYVRICPEMAVLMHENAVVRQHQ